MGLSLVGLLILSVAWSFPILLLSAGLVGLGSAVFHPESSRVARMASGGRHGFAQSLFQVGGNTGSAIGPLLAAFVVVPRGQRSVAWFSAARAGRDGDPHPGGRWYPAPSRRRRDRGRQRPGATTAVARARWSRRSPSC